MKFVLPLALFAALSTDAFSPAPHGLSRQSFRLSAVKDLEVMTRSELRDVVKTKTTRGTLDRLRTKVMGKRALMNYLEEKGVSSRSKTATPSGVIKVQAPAQSETKAFDKVSEVFPGALTNSELLSMINKSLEENGYDSKKTLVATSLCCDEVNRPLETDLSCAFDTNFNMGGLAGFPFGGATSFGAMAAHIPDDGSCLVVYGPHVGVDSTGAVGTVERRGRAAGGSCCGSAVAASGYVSGVYNGGEKAADPADALDAQQYYVGSMLLPFAEQLEKADEKMVELPKALLEAQTDLMTRIVKQSCGGVGGDGKIAVLGGIQVNTPAGFSDYYVPESFNLYNNKGELVEELW